MTFLLASSFFKALWNARSTFDITKSPREIKRVGMKKKAWQVVIVVADILILIEYPFHRVPPRRRQEFIVYSLGIWTTPLGRIMTLIV